MVGEGVVGQEGDEHVVAVEGAVGAVVFGVFVAVAQVEAGAGVEDEVAAAGGLEELQELGRGVGEFGGEGVDETIAMGKTSGERGKVEGVLARDMVFDEGAG